MDKILLAQDISHDINFDRSGMNVILKLDVNKAYEVGVEIVD